MPSGSHAVDAAAQAPESPAVRVRPGMLALLTGLVFAVGPATVDLTLPAMPAIQRAIGTAALRVELTLTLLLAALALSQLMFGAIVDRYGRRGPFLMSLAVYCAASLGAALAPGILTFTLARIVQAIGFGVAVVLIRCSVTDVCDERRTAGIFSVAVTMVSVASVVAPTIGGQLAAHFGWRAVFVAAAAFSLLTWTVAAVFLPETLPRERRTTAGLLRVLGTYWGLLRSSRFVVPAVIGASAAAYQFTYNTGGPSAVIEHYAVSPATAGMLFSLIALSTACASQVNALVLRWRAPEQITSAAVWVSVAASGALLLSVFTGAAGVAGLIGSLFILIATLGFIMGNTMAVAISSAGAQAGAASALVGVMQFLWGTVASAPVSVFHDPSGHLMGVVIGLLSLGAAVACVFGRSVWRAAAETP